MNRLTHFLAAGILCLLASDCLIAQCDIRINEIHYEQVGADADYIEVRIADPQPMSLTGYYVQGYNGSSLPANTYTPAFQLSSATVTSAGGYSYYVMSGSVQNGPYDGLALIAPCGPGGSSQVVEFISYAGQITAGNGPAAGMVSTDIGVFEDGATPVTHSLQVINGFWAGPLLQTKGTANAASPTICRIDSILLESVGVCDGFNSTYSAELTVYSTDPPVGGLLNINGQVFMVTGSPQTVTLTGLNADGQYLDLQAGYTSDPNCYLPINNFILAPAPCLNCADLKLRINEFHYDDPGSSDSLEFIELRSEYALPIDPSSISVYLYNGSDSTVYSVIPLSEFVETSADGFYYYTYDFGTNEFQNGPRDGMALVSACGVSEFISYEGVLQAKNGPAAGMTSMDVGVSEGPVLYASLQIIGNGWQGPIPFTKGEANEPFTDCTDSLELNIVTPVICLGDTLEITYVTESNLNEYSIQFNPNAALGSEQQFGNLNILKVIPTVSGIQEVYFQGVIHGCETPGSRYLVLVESDLEPNAGPDKEVCAGGVVAMEAEGVGSWSGGQGSFSNVNDPMASYSPADSETGLAVELYWTQSNSCGNYSDTALVIVTAPSEIYQMNCIGTVNFTLGPDCVFDLTYYDVMVDIPAGETFGVLVYDAQNRVIPIGQPVSRELIGQTYKYVAFGPYPCNNNSCWGELKIEDKLGPEIQVPDDVEINCLASLAPEALGFATGIDCGPVKATYKDIINDYECNGESTLLRRIDRVWTVMDDAGNATDSIQRIYIYNIGFKEISPAESLVEVPCGSDISPAGIQSLLGVTYAYPYYYDERIEKALPLSSEAICKYAITYTDSEPIRACGETCLSSYKVLRTWIILDWCQGASYSTYQIIKLVDDEAPEILVMSPDKTYSTDAWSCAIDIVLPDAVVTDNCDEHAHILKVEGPLGVSVNQSNGKWLALDVPKGETEFIYTATDCCGNLSTASITVEVVDKVPPVAIAKEFIVVSLTRTGLDSFPDGVAKVDVGLIDNGSYDNCSGVYLEIRRDATQPTCFNGGDLWNHDSNTSTPQIPWNNNRTYNGNINGLGQTNLIHENDRGADTDGGQYVTFCCEDVNAALYDIDGDGIKDAGYHKVWLRVWDDADMDQIFGSRGDQYTETWAYVKVEDKFTPVIVCEKDITTYCDRADLVLSLNKWTDVAGNVPAEYWPWIDGVCADLPLEFMDEGVITTCNTTPRNAPLKRTYRIKGTEITCSSSVYILDVESDPYLDWPIALHTWTKCELTVEDVLNNTVKAIGGTNILVNAGIEQDDFALPVVIEYVPYNWYEWMQTGANTPNLGQYCLSSGTNEIADNGTNGVTPEDGGLTEDLQGETRFNPNWQEYGCRVFGRKIIIDEYEVGEGCKKWLVRFEYIDWCNPDWAACLSTVYKYEDETPAVIEVSMNDTISVSVNCVTEWVTMPHGADDGGCDVGFHWEVTLSRGTYVEKKTAVGNDPKISFTTLESGTYRVHYKLTDGCGNVSEKEGELVVLGKAPTPYCINLSSAVMKNGVVELWAKDFDRGSYPNCKQGGLVYFTFDEAHPVWSKIDKYHFFMGDGIEVTGADTTSLYLAGIAQKWIPESKTSGKLFGCNVGDGSSFPASEIKMTVWDEDGLWDYCEVSLSLVDNQGACGEISMITIEGQIQTETGVSLANAFVEVRANMIGYPKQTKTDNEGKFAFRSLPIGISYEVGAELDVAYRNGVNTLDLVHIQRHILALKKLDSPYKMIAADADNDQQIRVEDLVQLRKLILGITDNLDSNESWRFVDKSQQMGEQPWPFKEAMTHPRLQESIVGDDFVAVKIGDVDASASTSLLTKTASERESPMRLVYENRKVNKGDLVEIDLEAADEIDLFGMQMGLKMNGMEIRGLSGKAINLNAENFALLSGGEMTLSWYDVKGIDLMKSATILTLTAKANRSGNLSELFEMSGHILNSEAYSGQNLKTRPILLDVRNGGKIQFGLYQNEPNPWRGETRLRYELPKPGNVILTISDITGKLIYTSLSKGEKGMNEMILTREMFGNHTGLLMYKLAFDGQSEVKKMILIE